MLGPEIETFLPTYLWPRLENETATTALGFIERYNENCESLLGNKLKEAAARQRQLLYNILHEFFGDDASLS